MNTPTLLSAEEITEMTTNVPDFWENLPQALQASIRSAYAQRSSPELAREATDAGNDSATATAFRDLFHQQLLEPVFGPHTALATEYTPLDAATNFQGVSCYILRVSTVQDMLATFAGSPDLQICFGLDKPLDQGGQLQLIFRGINGPRPAYLYLTRRMPELGDGPDTVRVRSCPINYPC